VSVSICKPFLSVKFGHNTLQLNINTYIAVNKIKNLFYGLKELEHRKLGLKVLIIKYDLGRSLSKEM